MQPEAPYINVGQQPTTRQLQQQRSRDKRKYDSFSWRKDRLLPYCGRQMEFSVEP